MPKPLRGSRKKAKRRARRQESAVATRVRKQVALRDGSCRLADQAAWGLFGACRGKSEWAHLRRRSATRGMEPARRHSTAKSVMFCAGHHQGPRGHERHGFEVEYRDPARGADGPLRFVRRDGQTFSEANF